MAKKPKQAEGVLADTARAIGSALGKLTVQAEDLTARAKQLHMPTKAEAKKMVKSLLSPKKKKKAAPRKKAAPKKKK